jgi:hypothetical protein
MIAIDRPLVAVTAFFSELICVDALMMAWVVSLFPGAGTNGGV